MPDIPFPSTLIFVVVIRVLLDRNVGEVQILRVNGCKIAPTRALDVIIRVALVSETREAASVEVECERIVTRAKTVESHVELFAPDQQRSVDVSLDNIRLCLNFKTGPKFKLRLDCRVST